MAVAWLPFRLDPPGRVAVEVDRAEDGALALAGRRVVARGLPPWAGAGVRAVESVTVELAVRPADPRQRGPARILTVSDGYTDANLMIGQHGDDLVVRVRRPGSSPAGLPPLVVRDVFAAGGWRQVAVAVDGAAVGVGVDGFPGRRLEVDGPPMRAWDGSYPVLIGDERPGGRVWHGEVRRARVTADGRTVDYLAPGALEVPEEAWYVPSRLREAAALPGGSGLRRSLLHLVAFVPVGALLAAAGRRPGVAAAVGAAAAFGLMLQLGKVAFDGRHPSALTVAAQVAGALAGSALLLYLRRRRLAAGENP